MIFSCFTYIVLFIVVLLSGDNQEFIHLDQLLYMFFRLYGDRFQGFAQNILMYIFITISVFKAVDNNLYKKLYTIKTSI